MQLGMPSKFLALEVGNRADYPLPGNAKIGHINNPPQRHVCLSMENCAMSDHRFEFKGWGLSVSATGFGIVAAVAIIVLLAWMPRPW